MSNKKKIIGGILIVVLIAVYIGLKTYANNIAEKRVNKVIGKVSNLIDVDYDNVNVDLIGLNIHIKGATISLSGEKISIDDIVVYGVDDEGEIPSYLHVSLNGINADANSLSIIYETLFEAELKARAIELCKVYKKPITVRDVKKLEKRAPHLKKLSPEEIKRLSDFGFNYFKGTVFDTIRGLGEFNEDETQNQQKEVNNFTQISCEAKDADSILKDLGYNNIKANIELDYKYDDKKKEFYFNTLSIDAENMGTVNLDFHISNIDLNPDNIISTFFFPSHQILIHYAELSYKDDSFVPRLQKRIEGADIFVDVLTTVISQENDKFIKQSMESLKEFINEPNKILISISPKHPVPIGRVQRVNNPKEIIKLLNVKIKI